MGPSLPDELSLSLTQSILCREIQLQQLTGLLNPEYPSPATLCIHGAEATGKTLAIKAILEALKLSSAIVRSQECITTRHLLERTIAAVRIALECNGESCENQTMDGRCDSISAFVVNLQRLLEGAATFVLVFDGIDRQREAAPTLLPALARLGEMIPNLTVVLIVTVPQPRSLHHAGIPHIHFPPYTRAQVLSIVSASPLPLHAKSTRATPASSDIGVSEQDDDTTRLWSRFCGAVWDSLGQGGARDIVSFRTVCTRLWRPFIQPILDGHYGPRDFSKLMVRNRSLFQSEAALTESIIPVFTNSETGKSKAPKAPLTLPQTATHLLLAAYLASHNPPRLDLTTFTKSSLRRKKRRNPAHTPNHRTTKHRKINRKLLGPQAFPLERWLAIFHAIVPDTYSRTVVRGGAADAMAQVATLQRLGLVVRSGVGDGELGGGKWRVGVGWEVVRGLARSVGFEMEDYLAE